ncbi:response regulator [Adhaeribacter rhizoryzae]|uniref:Response regulator n=1 Tax=Adhaeribacter rhizoryzae TaxID=2607907 RepID=A0A5M6DBR2_9BACT|nr:response regulator [Adhaeribacter rhizoryzae]KAA5544823.1 response regulator [Adhaeribacter rhizoryzae]
MILHLNQDRVSERQWNCGKRILLVDDNNTSLYLAQRILKKLELAAEILIARDGQEALNIIKAVGQSGQELGLILLDINMPVMDGFELLEELQNSADLRSVPCHIVLLSSSRHQLDLARASKYPIVDFIQKPLSPEKLARFL